ncbi:hypothetical protein K457DRAFT_1879507 [Linnemannia elongata AG-77]|uniref:Uncharacterized protein n=1 Tax=Linnemannia elongata AG-77 TaxID=1314771 RepID=A0A197JMC6_9FUNG|nr:hypothetical protein K457DRAFT_1879507 [Linnemannia elongata AG-77]
MTFHAPSVGCSIICTKHGLELGRNARGLVPVSTLTLDLKKSPQPPCAAWHYMICQRCIPISKKQDHIRLLVRARMSPSPQRICPQSPLSSSVPTSHRGNTWVAAANKDTSRVDPRSSFWDVPLITVENDQRMYDRPSPSLRWSQGSRRGINILQVVWRQNGNADEMTSGLE